MQVLERKGGSIYLHAVKLRRWIRESRSGILNGTDRLLCDCGCMKSSKNVCSWKVIHDLQWGDLFGSFNFGPKAVRVSRCGVNGHVCDRPQNRCTVGQRGLGIPVWWRPQRASRDLHMGVAGETGCTPSLSRGDHDGAPVSFGVYGERACKTGYGDLAATSLSWANIDCAVRYFIE